MPKELTLDGEGRLAERERPGEVRSSMQNPGRSRREALTLSCQGRHRPRFPAYCNGGLAMMPSLIHRSFFLQFHEYELCRLVSEHTAFQRGHIIALGLSKDLRIVRPCNPGSSDVFLLPPFALRPDFPISLVGRDSHDSLWWLCHLAARAV
jgi:hypothetical protein